MMHRLLSFLVSCAVFVPSAVFALPPAVVDGAKQSYVFCLDGELPGPDGRCSHGTVAGQPPTGSNTCNWTNNGRCDEFRFGGTGMCPDGTDVNDCRNASTPIPQGGDTCRWARDGECDDPTVPGHVTTACAPGTDVTDCSGGNTCRYANDGECDEPRFGGTGACPNGSDTADCRAGVPAQGNNSCRWAYDGECDDPTVPGHITTACPPGTDNHDCGR